MNNLHETLVKLASDEADDNTSNVVSTTTTTGVVQMRRAPVSTYKKIYSSFEFIAAELFHSLSELLTTQKQLPLWLAQRIAWWYVFEFGRDQVSEAFQVLDTNNDTQMIDKERIGEYVRANRRRIISEWMKQQRENYEEATTMTTAYSECGIKNKRRTMEDKTCVITSSVLGNSCTLFTLFDGHCGAECAEFVSKHLPVELAKAYLNNSGDGRRLVDQSMFEECFETVNQRFNKIASSQGIKSGSTACVGLLDCQRRVLHVAWCGDSQLCLVERGGAADDDDDDNDEWRVSYVSEPHKPNREDERRRIEEAGGRVSYVSNAWRVNESLAVSRSFGDLAYQEAALTCHPQYVSLSLLRSNSFFIIIGCDGFFEHVSLDHHDLFQRLDQQQQQQQSVVAEWLCGLARDNGSSDNISVIFVPLEFLNSS